MVTSLSSRKIKLVDQFFIPHDQLNVTPHYLAVAIRTKNIYTPKIANYHDLPVVISDTGPFTLGLG
jgi:hypothetical protein